MRRRNLIVGRARWAIAAFAIAFAAALFLVTSGAEAVVVDMNAVGSGTPVPFNSSDQSGYYGVSMVPGACSNDFADATTCSELATAGVPTVTSSAPCMDPWLSSDLWEMGQANVLPDDALCYHGGTVMNKNETFSLTWDQHRLYWSGTRAYVEQFMRDVADGSGTLTSPYALTAQYSDGSGHAANSSLYGGGCIDYGSTGGSKCDYGSPTGPGHDYGANGCNPSGDSFTDVDTFTPNQYCLTDAQIQGEVATMVNQTGIIGRTEAGHTPMVVVLTPPLVEDCLDAHNKLCSANGSLTPPAPTLSDSATGGTVDPGTYKVEITYVTAHGEQLPSVPASITTSGTSSTITVDSPPSTPDATGWYAYFTQPGGTTYALQSPEMTIGTSFVLSAPPTGGAAPPTGDLFCSYHSQVDVGGTEVPYVVQPWTPMTACDEPDVPAPQQNSTPQELAASVGARLVSPISRSQIAAVVNPNLNGWFAEYGAEVDDNAGCVPLGNGLDSVPVGNSSQNPYFLQREFDNAAALEFDPNTYFGCAPNVLLDPSFVVPSAVDAGDVVEFDGSDTASTLLVPNAGYQWNFGDGTTATGPSVEHVYSKGGTYTVRLTVTDRGGDVATLAQTITVIGSGGSGSARPPSGGGGNKGSSGKFSVRIQLMPQGLRSVLSSGIVVAVQANQAANGLAWVMISRSAAKRLHIKAGRGPSVVIGRGTVWQVKDGTVFLHLHLSRATARKLKHVKHVALTVRLALAGTSGTRVVTDAAGSY